MVFCRTCGQFLCTFCHEYHKHNKIISNHQIVGIDQESIRLPPSILTPTEHLCSQPNHKKFESIFYRETCQCPVGEYMVTLVLHKDHRIGEMCNIAKLHRDELRDALVCAYEMVSKLSNAIYAIDK